MLWTPVDLYCERTDATLFSEPINLITNLAFLIAAALVAKTCQSSLQKTPSLWLLVLLMALIGVGSAAFHSFANGLTMLFDVIPILVFILVYLFFWSQIKLKEQGLKRGRVFILFAALSGLGIVGGAKLPLNGSESYLGVWLMMPILCFWRGFHPWLAGAFSTFTLSLTMRVLDASLCSQFPYGTHGFWHILNALTLFFCCKALCQKEP